MSGSNLGDNTGSVLSDIQHICGRDVQNEPSPVLVLECCERGSLRAYSTGNWLLFWGAIGSMGPQPPTFWQ